MTPEFSVTMESVIEVKQINKSTQKITPQNHFPFSFECFH